MHTARVLPYFNEGCMIHSEACSVRDTADKSLFEYPSEAVQNCDLGADVGVGCNI